MTAKWRLASPLSLAVVVLVGVLSVVAFFLIRSNSSQQSNRLLRDEVSQASLIGSSTFDAVVTEVTGLVTPVAQYEPARLQSTVTSVAKGGASAGAAVAVFEPTSKGFVAVAGAGPGLSPGRTASGDLAVTLSQAQHPHTGGGLVSASYVPGQVERVGTSSAIGFASLVGGNGASSDQVVYFAFRIDPFTAVSTLVTNKGPFEQLRLALYGSVHADADRLVVATTRDLPLGEPSVTTLVPVGTGKWLLVAQARTPLAGSFSAAAPWVILGMGLFLALALGSVVEVLVRRHRYAEEMVAARTEQLEASLKELREAQEKLVRSERLSALGEMASVVGHELRNPLTAVTNALFLLRRGLDERTLKNVERHIDMAEREATKAATLAEDLNSFVRPRRAVMTSMDVAEVVEEVVEASPPPDGVHLDVRTSPTAVVADRGQLAEVLTNLVTNAYQAVDDEGSVTVSARTNGTAAVIVVEDTGPGFEKSDGERVFEPFFTTKPTGTGLGLAIVRRLVEAHGGEISIENGNSRGARVTVKIPGGRSEDGAARSEQR
jgi:signal transduction histidine kinase